MKIIKNIRALAFLSSLALSQYALADVTQKLELTAEQVSISAQNTRFLERLVGGLKADLFRGRAQNFSAFNLDLDTFIHFNKSPLPNNPNPLTFNIASRGDQILHGVPMWSIQGFVVSHLDEVFKIDGVETRMVPQKDVFYLVESAQGHRERMKRFDMILKKSKFYQDYVRESNEKDANDAYQKASGRIIGVVSRVDLKELSMEFYQVVPDTNELVRAGVFNGISSPAY